MYELELDKLYAIKGYHTQLEDRGVGTVVLDSSTETSYGVNGKRKSAFLRNEKIYRAVCLAKEDGYLECWSLDPRKAVDMVLKGLEKVEVWNEQEVYTKRNI